MRWTNWMRWSLFACSGLLLASACSDGGENPPASPTPTPIEVPSPDDLTPSLTPTPGLTPTPTNADVDEDGYTVGEGDCDDEDASINPDAAEEPYDGVDQDCDGEDLTDVDNDGYDGEEAGGDDCDDDNQATHPGAPEIEDDKDNDCDGEVDEELDTNDDDGDGFSEATGDCDDGDPNAYPDAEETPYDGIDQDCDGLDADDLDGDGAKGGPDGTDCDDEDASVHPGATEVPYDGVDQDCEDGDEVDVDDDTFPGGEGGTDCDDEDPAINPDATEVPYDGIDQDCADGDEVDVDDDGQPAEEVGGPDCNDNDDTIYLNAPEEPYDGIDQDCDGADEVDVDDDGFPSTAVEGGTDCNDNDSTVNPDVEEYADGKDNDCDGQVDEDLDTTDDDGDGYSEAAGDCNDYDDTVNPEGSDIPYDGVDQDCAGGDEVDVDDDGFASSQVAGGTDCNDNDPDINPDGVETAYDSIDQDCSGSDLVDVDQDGYASTQVSGGTDCDDDNSAVNPVANEVPYDGVDQDCKDGDLVDVDGDGYASSAVSGPDCNDADKAINPAADELCDGIDNNCDNVVDTDAVDRDTWYVDGDGDDYGDPAQPVLSCTGSDTLVLDNSDCDDTTASSNPAASEVCDGRDNNCDGVKDEGVQTTYYKDADEDTYGDAASSTQACSQPAGYVSDKTDCDDSSKTTYPGATETCNLKDDDCDKQTDEGVQTTYYKDNDKDGYGNASETTQACSAPAGYVANSTDCKDTNDQINPGAGERCDGIDNNCDNLIDNGVTSTYYQDNDRDGYGNPAVSVQNCNPPTGFVANNTDCNDANALVHPNAAEACNGVDEDCDSQIDEGVKNTYYKDGDGDTYGDANQSTQACTQPSGYVTSSTDCDDTKASVNPAGTETCNGIDDDCDRNTDEDVKTLFYKDADNDTYGKDGDTTQACTKPTGYATRGGDCDDTKSAVNPAATETCNAVDDDCDAQIDENVKTTYYRDADGDTYGDSNSSTQACSQPSGYVTRSGDCDDTKSAVNPAATEVCNGVDDDCDSVKDDGVTKPYYADGDGDGYGQTGASTQACSKPTGYAELNGDCDDTDRNVYPGATETCDAKDNDCDSQVDEGAKSTFYRDQDADGYGVATTTTQACSAPSGYAAQSGDCNDSDADMNPGETEVCDGKDNNCASGTDEVDADNDGIKPIACGGTDCNDNDKNSYPSAAEVCDDGVDQNCDGRDHNCWGTATWGTAKWHP